MCASSKRTIAFAVAALVAGLALTAPAGPAAAADGSVATPPTATGTRGLQQALDQLVQDGAPGALLYSYDKGQITALQSGLAVSCASP